MLSPDAPTFNPAAAVFVPVSEVPPSRHLPRIAVVPAGVWGCQRPRGTAIKFLASLPDVFRRMRVSRARLTGCPWVCPKGHIFTISGVQGDSAASLLSPAEAKRCTQARPNMSLLTFRYSRTLLPGRIHLPQGGTEDVRVAARAPARVNSLRACAVERCGA